MGCKDCDESQENGETYYYRWDIANIAILACPKHAREVINFLNSRGD